MHIVEIQYFRKSLQILNADSMHDLYPIYLKVRRHVKAALKDYLVQGDNLNIYPNLPRMSDLELICPAILHWVQAPYDHFCVRGIPALRDTTSQCTRHKLFKIFDANTIIRLCVNRRQGISELSFTNVAV